LLKKIHVTGSGKIKVRATGQNHHNLRDTGKQTRNKRNDRSVFRTVEKSIQKRLAI
jgi:ribosomal protein L35